MEEMRKKGGEEEGRGERRKRGEEEGREERRKRGRRKVA